MYLINKLNFKKKILLLYIYSIFFVISFITNILNSIISDIKDSFELNLILLGMLPFTFFIAYGIMSIPSGFLVERYRKKNLLLVSFAVITLAVLFFSSNINYITFCITLFLLGCSMSVLQVIINPMLRVSVGPKHFAFSSVIAQLVYGSASFISPNIYQNVVNNNIYQNNTLLKKLLSFVPNNMNWVSLYLIFAIIGFVFFCFTFLIIPNESRKSKSDVKNNSFSHIGLLKNKWTILYFFAILCYVGVEQGIANWISQFLFQYHNISPQLLGADIISYYWALLTIGCILGLILLRLFDSRKILIIFTIMTIICLLFSILGKTSVALIFFPLIGFLFQSCGQLFFHWH